MRQQLITIPLLDVLVQWIKDRLNEKSNTNHTHPEYVKPVIVLTEAEFNALTPDPSKVYIVY